MRAFARSVFRASAVHSRTMPPHTTAASPSIAQSLNGAAGRPFVQTLMPRHLASLTIGGSNGRGYAARSSAVEDLDLAPDDKVLHLVRHGVTEMNVYLSQNRWDAPDFQDPGLYDTRLVPEGEEQARRAGLRAMELDPPPEVLLSSPLTRALSTADLVFSHLDDDVERVSVPEARERLWHSAEVGRAPAELSADFPGWDHSSIDADIWWHTDGSGDPEEVVHEPDDVFRARMRELVELLAARPERVVAVVCHWGVLQALTGRDFENCEIYTCRLSDLQGLGAP